jgi:carbon storage regulator
MLTLTRKSGERIRIGHEIILTVREINGNQVKIGIEAPMDVQVFREELYLKIAEANQEASQTSLEDLERLVGGGVKNDD